MKKCKIVIFKNNEDTVKGVLFNTLKHRKAFIKVIK